MSHYALKSDFLRVGGHTAAREVRRGDKRLKEGAADIQDGGNRKVGVRSLTWIFWRDLQITIWGSLKRAPTELGLGLELVGQHLLRAHRALGTLPERQERSVARSSDLNAHEAEARGLSRVQS